jgi:hypothetical protein
MLNTVLAPASASSNKPVRASIGKAATATPWGFAEWFLIAQLALPALLYLPGTNAYRVPIRIAPFAISLLGFLTLRAKPSQLNSVHPARGWLLCALACLALMVIHPTTNSYLAGAAQAMLYLCVMAPVFWVPSLVRNPAHLARLLFILLICNGINAIVGILQVYDPDRWMPTELSRVIVGAYDIGSLSYKRWDGRVIIRPPGLSDNPGAVCGPSMIAAMLGLSFCASSISLRKKLIGLAFALAGIVAIYLSFVRTSLLIVAGSLLVYGWILLMQRSWRRALWFSVILAVIAFVSFSGALLLGGESIVNRFETLLEGDPITVYYSTHRGQQLEAAFTKYLKEYPLGAGLGRWGMMRYYFGDPRNRLSPALWAELQVPAWILDGGLILMALYCLALISTTVYEYRLARWNRSSLRSWAAIIFAINVGTLGLIFGFTPFTTQVGLQYWFLTGALVGAARGDAERQRYEQLRVGEWRLCSLGRDGPRQL